MTNWYYCPRNLGIWGVVTGLGRYFATRFTLSLELSDIDEGHCRTKRLSVHLHHLDGWRALCVFLFELPTSLLNVDIQVGTPFGTVWLQQYLRQSVMFPDCYGLSVFEGGLRRVAFSQYLCVRWVGVIIQHQIGRMLIWYFSSKYK